MVEIKCTRWTSVDTWQHLRHSMQIERQALRDDSNSQEHVVSSGCSISDQTDVT